MPAARAAEPGGPGRGGDVELFHLGDWEEEIGYSQAVRVGNRILVSGTVGDEAKDLAGQALEAYEVIRGTLAHHGATFAHVIKETVYCRDIEALKAIEPERKAIYGGHCPATTWVQVERLYSEGHLVEIELEAVLEDD